MCTQNLITTNVYWTESGGYVLPHFISYTRNTRTFSTVEFYNFLRPFARSLSPISQTINAVVYRRRLARKKSASRLRSRLKPVPSGFPLDFSKTIDTFLFSTVTSISQQVTFRSEGKDARHREIFAKNVF